jgi:hypothetical protein
MAPEKQKGGRFPEGSWKVLEEIVINGNDGRYLEIVRNRDMATNMAKAQVWNTITNQFNEVGTLIT